MSRALLLCVLLAGCGGGGGGGSSPKRPPAPPAPPPAPVRQLPVLGLGSHLMDAQTRAQLRDLGVTHVRYTLHLPLWTEHPSHPISVREQLEAAAREGFDLLIVAHPLPEGWTPGRYAALVGQLAAEFPQVEAWQLGNEEPFGGSVAAHAEYHRAAYAAVKAADPDALVVSMAWTTMEQAREFVATGAPFDALAVHTYGYPVAETVKRWEPLARDHAVWATEFGFQPAQRALEWEAEQARQWKAAVAQMGASGFGRGYGYQLLTDEPAELLGIVRPDGSLRPAALWLREVLR